MRLNTIAIAALAAAAAGFVAISALAADNDRFEGDLWATRQLQKIDSDAIDRVVDVTEDIGDDPYVIVIWVAAAGGFFFRGGWTAPAMFGLAGGLRMVNPLLKEIIERPRPPASLVDVSEFPGTFSFPSGHATTAMILFGLIFYFSQVYVKETAPRLALQAGCVWMIMVVGFERVYEGEHWPSDVLGGYWFGALVVAAIVFLHRYLSQHAIGVIPPA